MSKANPKDPHELDAHPVVRAFFAGRLEETAPEAAKAAHDILYRHYAAAAPDLPDTLEEMQPLFHAVQHGVKAGRAQEAFDEVFWRRIRRGNRSISLQVLGRLGQTSRRARRISSKRRGDKPRRDLRSPRSKHAMLNDAAFALTALGRLSDSVEPRRAGLDMPIAQARLGQCRAAPAATSPTRC